jgi:monoamine oxidase
MLARRAAEVLEASMIGQRNTYTQTYASRTNSRSGSCQRIVGTTRRQVVRGGYGAITAPLAHGLDVRYGTPVLKVKHGMEGVEVSTATGTVRGSVVIVTVHTPPPAALPRLTRDSCGRKGHHARISIRTVRSRLPSW